MLQITDVKTLLFLLRKFFGIKSDDDMCEAISENFRLVCILKGILNS